MSQQSRSTNADHRDVNERDPGRRLAAAHELGHYYAFRAGGFDCTPPRISGHGRAVSGEVTAEVVCKTRAQMRAYVIAILAGRAAGQLWAAQPGETARQTRSQCSIDEALARDALRHALARGMSRNSLYRDARTFVRRHWPRIVRHVPELARTGRITTREVNAA